MINGLRRKVINFNKSLGILGNKALFAEVTTCENLFRNYLEFFAFFSQATKNLMLEHKE